MMRTISFFNRKGGAGKTALCFLTARYLAAAGRRVLVMDLDPQKTLTNHFTRLYRQPVAGGIGAGNTRAGDVDVGDAFGLLLEKHTIHQATVMVSERLSLVPGSFDLSEIQSNVAVYAVRDALEPLAGEAFDFCLIDNAPNWSALIQASLSASELIVIPSLPAIEDLEQAQWSLNRAARVSTAARKIVLNQHGAKPGRQVRELLEHFQPVFNGFILDAWIPQSALVRRYTGTGESITRAAKSKQSFLFSFSEFVREITAIDAVPEAF